MLRGVQGALETIGMTVGKRAGCGAPPFGSDSPARSLTDILIVDRSAGNAMLLPGTAGVSELMDGPALERLKLGGPAWIGAAS